MSDIFPEFRHSVDDGACDEILFNENACCHANTVSFFSFYSIFLRLSIINKKEPTEDWTVEEVMQWSLLRCHEATDAKKEELVHALNEQLEAGTRELWQSHEIAASTEPTENADPQQTNDGDSKPMATTTKQSNEIKYIHVEVTEGVYTGKTFKLQPKPRAPCWVGRSAGKKFRERGISLAKDDEVSTTHGKFELKNGKATFTDTGSTNGTVHEGVELEDNVAFDLKDGMSLRMGCTVVKISLLTT